MPSIYQHKTRSGELIYPQTVSNAVIDPDTGQNTKRIQENIRDAAGLGASFNWTPVAGGASIREDLINIQRGGEFASHVSNRNNPHQVTKTQVGLGNVDNKSSETIRSEITPGNISGALGFTPESSLNKVTSISGTSTDTQYPSAKATWDMVSSLDEATSVALSELDRRIKIIPITWSELKELRDNRALESGSFYRITDYTCTTSQTGTRSAGHRFDIVLQALSEGVLSEQARAMHNGEDQYFNQEKLSAWKLMYCLDNDTDRFSWANTEIQFPATVKITEGGTTKTLTYGGSYSNVSGFTGRVHYYQSGSSQYLVGNGTEIWEAGTHPLVQGVSFVYMISSYEVIYSEYALDEPSPAFVSSTEPRPVGRGVIYGMIDEFGNDVGYDFKNIQFLRDNTWKNTKITTKLESNPTIVSREDFLAEYATQGECASYLVASDNYYYTFSYIRTGSTVAEDLSLGAIDKDCYNNKITLYDYTLPNIINVGYEPLLSATILVYGNNFIGCKDLTFGAYKNYYNSFYQTTSVTINGRSIFSYNNFLGEVTQSGFSGTGEFVINTITGLVKYIDIRGKFRNNIISGDFYDIIIKYECVCNSVSGICSENLCDCPVKRNMIGGYWQDNYQCDSSQAIEENIFGGYFQHNKFHWLGYSVFNGVFNENTCDHDFGEAIISTSIRRNTFKQNILRCTFEGNFLDNVVDCAISDCRANSGTQYVKFNGDSTVVKHYVFESGIQGTSGNLLQVTPQTGSTVERHLAVDSGGNIVDYVPADLVSAISQIDLVTASALNDLNNRIN